MFFKYLDRTQTYYSSCEECRQIVTKQDIYCGPNYLRIIQTYHSSHKLFQQIFPNYFDILPKQTNFTPNYFHQSQIFQSTGIMPHVHLGMLQVALSRMEILRIEKRMCVTLSLMTYQMETNMSVCRLPVEFCCFHITCLYVLFN